MHECAEFESLIDREHAGEELADAERERLLDHLETCRSCDELFELLREVAAVPGADEPSDAELAALRRRVRGELERPARHPFRRAAAPRGWLPVGLAAAAAVAGLALGWALATAREVPASAAGGAAWLAEQVRRDAVGRASFAEAADSPYVFSEVRVDAAADGRVRLAFDVARHLELELRREDPLLAAVLTQALLAPGSAGARLAAIEAAPPRLDPRVKQALLVALRDDESLAVRLRAQQRLAALAGDAEVAEAMLRALAEDDAVELRFGAIDYLTGNRVAPERLESAIRARDDAGDRALLVRARDYLSRSDSDDDTKGPQS